jgi:hypothetical protein
MEAAELQLAEAQRRFEDQPTSAPQERAGLYVLAGDKVRAFGRTWTVKKVTAKMVLLAAPKLPKLPAAERWAYQHNVDRVPVKS